MRGRCLTFYYNFRVFFYCAAGAHGILSENISIDATSFNAYRLHFWFSMCWPDYAASLLLLLMSLLMQHVAMHFIILLSIVMRTMKTMNERKKNVSIAKTRFGFGIVQKRTKLITHELKWIQYVGLIVVDTTIPYAIYIHSIRFFFSYVYFFFFSFAVNLVSRVISISCTKTNMFVSVEQSIAHTRAIEWNRM